MACEQPKGIDKLDTIDRRILFELQEDGRIANNILAEKVGLSPPPCLRRVRTLRANGVIKSIRAVVDEKLLGYGAVSFLTVGLESQSEPGLRAFEASIQNRLLVQQCWLTVGEMDYLLKCVAQDLAQIKALILDIAALPNVRTVRSFLTLRMTKDQPLPLP